MTPLVSILIPCYNAERWVKQAIESALAQTWPEKEVIVIDDGSTDGSLPVIQSFGDKIRWETGPNRGGNAARNRLLELARGEWLQYLDADDYLLPDKVEQQVRFLQERPDTDIVYCRVIQETRSEAGVFQNVSRLPKSFDPWVLLVSWDLGQTGGQLWRKSAVAAVGGWKVNQPCCQEHELFLRLLMAGKKFSFCTHVGAVYRQWKEGSVCTKNPREVNRRRFGIIHDAEQFLREHDELNSERLWAINHGRMEVARIAWQYDRPFAIEIAATIRQAQPDFVPGGPGSQNRYSLGYRVAYRLFGYQGAEKLADWVRASTRFFTRSGSSSKRT